MSGTKHFIDEQTDRGNNPLEAIYEPPYDAQYYEWLLEQQNRDMAYIEAEKDREQEQLQQQLAEEEEETEEKQEPGNEALQCFSCSRPLDDQSIYEEPPITAGGHYFCSHSCKRDFLEEATAQKQMMEMGG